MGCPGIAGGAQRRGCAHRAERIARVLPVLLAGGYLFFAFRRAGRLWQQAASPDVSSAWPVPGPMLAPFSGDELVYNETLGDWRTHNGVDLAAEAGEPVKAAALGRVSAVYQDAVWGWTVEVSDGSRVYRYQGLEAPAVQADDEVHAGDVLGKVGRVPAEAKLPSHLHFEVRQDGSCVDPETALG